MIPDVLSSKIVAPHCLKRCPYSELFWSAFSRIRTERREILCISPYSVRMRENKNQSNSEFRHFLRSASQYLLILPLKQSIVDSFD